MDNFSYLVGEEGGEVACIDPGWDAERIAKLAEGNGVHITKILLTHVHYDHSGAAEDLSRRSTIHRAPIEIFASANIPSWKRTTNPDRGKWIVPEKFTPIFVGAYGNTPLRIGGYPITVYDAPGHQSDHLLFTIGKYLFTGDTLFIGSIGGTHFADSDPKAMEKTLAMIYTLPDDLVVCPGHDYGEVKMRSLEEEKRLNPYLSKKEESF